MTTIESIAQQLVEASNTGNEELFKKAFNNGVTINNYNSVYKKYTQLLSKSRQRYVYLVTFTLKPELHDNQDSIKAARQYISSLPDRKGLFIVKSEWREELTKKGVPHWHLACLVSQPLAKSRFIWWTSKYGFVDVSKTKDKSLTTSEAYQKALEYTVKEDELIEK